MLNLTFGGPAVVFLTLAEKTETESFYFLFVFTPRTPGQEVTAVLQPDEVTERYEQFTIDVDTVFEGRYPGQYSYSIYALTAPDATPTDPPIEVGLALLKGDNVAYTSYQSNISYVQPQ